MRTPRPWTPGSLEAMPCRAALGQQQVRARLSGAVGRLLPGWLYSHREDIIQSCVVRILLVERTRPDMTINATYLHQVARTTVIDHVRRLGRELPLGPQDDIDAAAQELADHACPDRRLRLRRALQAGLSRLPAPRRAAVELHLLGCSVPEAARRLGWNDKRAENAIYRGLAQLRRYLTAVDEVPA